MVGFSDRDQEREALIEVHRQCLAALLGVIHQDRANQLLRTESVRFFDESLWAITEIRPSLKHDARYVGEDVKVMIDAHNTAPQTWRYKGPCEDWLGRTDPRKCAEHEHVVLAISFATTCLR
jgi:hypothetical protein